MIAAIITSGDELTTGERVDTNTAWLSEQLDALGVHIACHLTVGDDHDRLLWAFAQASAQADFVVVTGGLGPTDDDLTRFVLADFSKTKLVERPDLVEQIAAFFARRGREMKALNRVQAMLPEGSTVIENTTGTAPGIRMEIDGKMFFALPGVPREMKKNVRRIGRAVPPRTHYQRPTHHQAAVLRDR